MELVKKEKLALHFFKEGLVIDKNFKSSDLAMWQMQILSANMFVNSTRDNVKRSEERMLNEGLLPGPAPIGYLNTKDAMVRRPSSLTQTVDISSKNYLKSIPLGYFQWTSWLKSPKTGDCETVRVVTRLPKPNLQIFCKTRFIMA